MLSRRCLHGGIPSYSPRSSGLKSSARLASTFINRSNVLMNERQAQVARSPKSVQSKVSPITIRHFQSTSLRLEETVKVPQMAESITEGTLKQWNKKKGDFVNADEEVATIETDKIDVSVNAPQSGTITEILANEEDTVAVGQDLFKLEPGEAPAEGSSGGEEKKEEDAAPKKEEKSEKKDEGKGKEEDSKKSEEKDNREAQKATDKKPPAKQSGDAKPAPPKSSSPSPPKKESSDKSKDTSSPPPAAPGSREERRVKMSRMRLRIAERLKQSQNTAASLTTFNEIDMSALMAFRARHKDRILKEQGVKLGFMGLFAKASAMALKEIPAANASIEGEGLGDTIVYRDYVDLSVAVSTEKGLVTPVVRNVEALSVLDIEREIAALGKKARDNKLTLEDMSGGTFTISNGGVFGSLFGTPILNLPAAAILGMHAINQKPWVVEGGKIEARPIMVIALTYDHRLLDGREAVTFLVRLKQYLEDPALLAL
ncbi:hypothetical protein CBS101457_005449 [Exobasidium rhododendri]|nr:hypothetical protein CBS101457_005449 [Exobasidium rhododendri]